MNREEELAGIRTEVQAAIRFADDLACQGDDVMAMRMWNEAMSMLDGAGDFLFKSVLLDAAAKLAADAGDQSRAISMWDQCIAALDSLGDHRGKVLVHDRVGHSFMAAGEPARALERWEEALRLATALSLQNERGRLLGNMASVLANLGDQARADGLWNEALDLMKASGDAANEIIILKNRTSIAEHRRDWVPALEGLRRLLILCESQGVEQDAALTLARIGSAAVALHQYSVALRFWGQALDRYQHLGLGDKLAWVAADMARVASNLRATGEALAEGEDLARATESVRHTLALSERCGDQVGVGEARAHLEQLALRTRMLS